MFKTPGSNNIQKPWFPIYLSVFPTRPYRSVVKPIGCGENGWKPFVSPRKKNWSFKEQTHPKREAARWTAEAAPPQGRLEKCPGAERYGNQMEVWSWENRNQRIIKNDGDGSWLPSGNPTWPRKKDVFDKKSVNGTTCQVRSTRMILPNLKGYQSDHSYKVVATIRMFVVQQVVIQAAIHAIPNPFTTQFHTVMSRGMICYNRRNPTSDSRMSWV